MGISVLKKDSQTDSQSAQCWHWLVGVAFKVRLIRSTCMIFLRELGAALISEVLQFGATTWVLVQAAAGDVLATGSLAKVFHYINGNIKPT